MSPDLIALEKLSDGYETATTRISSRCNIGCAATRRMLYRMAARGLVEPVRAFRTGRTYWWRITDAGRAALEAKP